MSMPVSLRSVRYSRCAAWSISMMSADRVWPAIGGMGILVSWTVVVSAATAGRVVGVGAAGLAAGDGLAPTEGDAAGDAAGLTAGDGEPPAEGDGAAAGETAGLGAGAVVAAGAVVGGGAGGA